MNKKLDFEVLRSFSVFSVKYKNEIIFNFQFFIWLKILLDKNEVFTKFYIQPINDQFFFNSYKMYEVRFGKILNF